jgi:hypothetical protein
MTRSTTTVRTFEFEPTPAVLNARTRGRFLPCPVCGADHERYLFHKLGARFVRCRVCGLVYVNPPGSNRSYLDVGAAGQHDRPRDRSLFLRDVRDVVTHASEVFARERGRPPRHVLLTGRTLPPDAGSRASIGAEVVHLDPEETQVLIADGDSTPVTRHVTDRTDILVLYELLEACPHAGTTIDGLRDALPPDALVVVVFSNVGSLPARLMRRWWPRFFAWKSVYYDTNNLARLLEDHGFKTVAQSSWRTSYSVSYALERLRPSWRLPARLDRARVGRLAVRVPAGTYVSTFRRGPAAPGVEKLSVIMPVYNEREYVAPVLDRLIAKDVSIAKEIIVVESNSSDGTRAVVEQYEGTPGVRIVYEDRPEGKGAAVRRGLEAATGSIVLIQDADFEYDLDDYDALLEPILQRRTSFVLGSRSLGLDDWKVRRYASSRAKALLMNTAQVVFAKTFNVLYQQRVTDVNTMYKVFRRECVENTTFVGRGFNFDIELACKIVVNGFSPMEVPVNYVARGFDEGKKINFFRDFFPSYAMFYRCRFGSGGRRR